MKRREFIRNTGLAAAGLALGGTTARAQTRPPNFLLIEVDQMRYPCWMRMTWPENMARIVRDGVNFTRHFTSASPCSPSRACLFTGTYTTQNGMLVNCDFVSGKLQPSLSPEVPNLGHMFQKAGYHTPYRGKWHLTRGKDRNPHDPLIDYGWEGWKRPDAPFGGPPYNGELVDPVYAREAVKWLESKESTDRPWFLVCNLINPHDICAFPRYYPQTKLKPIRTDRLPENFHDDLTGKPGVHLEYRARWASIAGDIDLNDGDAWRRYLDFYADCQEMVDRQVGRVLDALERSGHRENTIVIFTSDHGEMAGSHGLRTKGNFVYEEVMRTPLVVSWPGRLPQGVESEALVSNVDVVPTLLSLAGISCGNYLAGLDLSPVLRDPACAAVREDLIFHVDDEAEVTPFGKDPDRPSSFVHPAHIRCLRERDWKYGFYFKPGTDETEQELYNLKDDPLEMDNLARDPGYRKKVKEMHDRLFEQEQSLLRDYKS